MTTALERDKYPGWVASGKQWTDRGAVDHAWRRHAARTGCRGEAVDRLGGPIFGSHRCGDCQGGI